MRLATPRLELIAADAAMARTAVDDPAELARLLGAALPSDWPPALFAEGLEDVAARLASGVVAPPWFFWYLVRTDGERRLVGGMGFDGEPRGEGILEVGYAVVDSSQRLGLATEALVALSGWAFSDERVRQIVAHTYRHLVASIRVLEKSGFRPDGEGPEPDLLHFSRRR